MFKRQPDLLYIIAFILLPATLILHNFVLYKFLLFYAGSYILFILYLSLPLIVYLIVSRVLKRKNPVVILILVLLFILYFFFGALQDFFLKYPLTRQLGKTYVLPFIFLLPFIYLFFYKAETIKFLRAICFIIIFFFLGELSLFFWNLKNFDESPKLKEQVNLEHKATADGLNIFHIVFDGYTNSATLKELFNFSNDIDSFLVQNGFYVAGRSKSNYNFTPYSFSSILNLSYLEVTPAHLVRNSKNFFLGEKNYKDNLVFNFFRKKGYRVMHYSLLDDHRHIDRLGNFAPRTPAHSVRYQTLERIALNPWLWTKIKKDKSGLPAAVRENLAYYDQYNKKGYDVLASNMGGNSKTYCLVHFFLPHAPYVYTGTRLDSLTLEEITNQQGYVEQVGYTNELIKKIVVELKKDKRNIIVIQGDHGFRDFDISQHPVALQNEVLNAFYFPNGDYGKLSDSISLVNTYRVILDQYFQQNLPLLKDEYFIAK
jgi:hypothetical protein